MNAARVENSARLRRVLDFLGDGAWRSTREIVMAAEVMAVSAAVSELRANGLSIECDQRGRVFYYRWNRQPVQLELAA